ncbi:hypothetical protein JCM16776_0464 [Leptotrichia shahii]|uniref:DUF4912 domain-containing protein n=1 Tax=Leptotrichia shahii TaxID=157691 RepID=A0A510JLN5_9FUSO|nr:DUF4912 domain-containing protein [Leptotrichia shahii]BBM40250.1 hypothetical protein JCM16776_0464 [Leptotrichia shahii]
MEQLKKNRTRTFYRNYANEKLIGNKNNKELKKLERFVSMEVIEKEIIEKILIKYFFMKRSRTFYRNFANKKLFGILGRKYRKLIKAIDFNYEKISPDQIRRRYVETEINRSKFAKGVEFDGKSNHEDIYFDKAPLPAAYFTDELILMPKNPTTLYVYWEIRDDTFERLAVDNGVIDNVVIKLFKDGYEYRKIIRHERIGSHYITEIDANQNYEASIGYEDQYGNFSEVAHSAEAIAPNDKVSDNIDLLWGTVKFDENTNQLIKYINTPVSTPEGRELLGVPADLDLDENDEFIIEVVERLTKVGASESLIERKVIKGKLPHLKLDMSGSRSS